MKRIIFCFDGTWQNLSQRFQTNVAKTASAVLPKCDRKIEQIVFYSEGVGNERGVWPKLTTTLGGAFGSGLEDDLRRAYHFLCYNFQEDDDIFIFGFSRGAFTARSFCGLLNHCGVLKRNFMEHESFMFDEYKSKTCKKEKLENTKRNFCHKINRPLIKYLGIWDTVRARGLPHTLKLAQPYNRKYDFHDIGLNKAYENARHAVAADEIRNLFPPELWSPADIAVLNSSSHASKIEQLWFAGDHGNVGGGAKTFAMSNTALIWIWQKAKELGLELNPADWAYIEKRTITSGSDNSKEISYPTSFRKGFPYSLAGFRPREGLVSSDDLHPSVLDRINKKVEYWPKAYPKTSSKIMKD